MTEQVDVPVPTPKVDVESPEFRGRVTTAAARCMGEVAHRPQIAGGQALLDTTGYAQSGRTVIDVLNRSGNPRLGDRRITFVGDDPESMTELTPIHTSEIGPDDYTLGFTQRDGRPDALHRLTFNTSSNQYTAITTQPLEAGTTVDPSRWRDHQEGLLRNGTSENMRGFVPSTDELLRAASEQGLTAKVVVAEKAENSFPPGKEPPTL